MSTGLQLKSRNQVQGSSRQILFDEAVWTTGADDRDRGRNKAMRQSCGLAATGGGRRKDFVRIGKIRLDPGARDF